MSFRTGHPIPMRAIVALAIALPAVGAAAQTVSGTTCGTNHVTEVESGALQLPSTDAIYPIQLDAGRQLLMTIAPTSAFSMVVLLCEANVSSVSHCASVKEGGQQIGWLNGPANYSLIIESAAASDCGTFTISSMTE